MEHDSRPVLDFEVAREVAASLVTIGHPFAAAAIAATAGDLVQWCRGAIFDQRVLNPEDQAHELVSEARLSWAEGWPERGGTQKLLELFRSKYRKAETKAAALPEMTSEAQIADYLRRGMLAPPCESCGPDAPYCEYGGPQSHKHHIEFWAANLPAPKTDAPKPEGKTLPRITLEGLLRDAEQRHREDLQVAARNRQMVEERYGDGYRL